jgi:nucleoside 2-deoxyribosyltransferase
MTVELRDVLAVTRQIRGNDSDSGTHYLLGYLWANTSEHDKQKIAKLFTNDLLEQEKNK